VVVDAVAGGVVAVVVVVGCADFAELPQLASTTTPSVATASRKLNLAVLNAG
jgi:hypothetical protein